MWKRSIKKVSSCFLLLEWNESSDSFRNVLPTNWTTWQLTSTWSTCQKMSAWAEEDAHFLVNADFTKGCFGFVVVVFRCFLWFMSWCSHRWLSIAFTHFTHIIHHHLIWWRMMWWKIRRRLMHVGNGWRISVVFTVRNVFQARSPHNYWPIWVSGILGLICY